MGSVRITELLLLRAWDVSQEYELFDVRLCQPCVLGEIGKCPRWNVREVINRLIIRYCTPYYTTSNDFTITEIYKVKVYYETRLDVLFL